MKHTPNTSTKTKTFLSLLTATLLLTACGGDNGKGKQNSTHSLINNPPLAQEQNLTLKEDTQHTITLTATDIDKDTIGYRVSKQPSHGTLTGKAPKLSYTPNKNYNGIDSFTFIANDGAKDSKEASIALNIMPMADLKEIKLTLNKTTLNKDTNTTYTIQTTLDKGEVTKALQQKIEHIQIISKPKDAIKVNTTNKTIQALKDGNLTLHAKADSIISNPTTLHVYWEVNGHRLPPEPDPKKNNATVLGIDSNNNGVRDDVERYLYAKYGKMHPINVAIGMEAAKVYQKILAHPERAEELTKESENIVNCEAFLQYSDNPKIKKIFPKEINSGYFEKSIAINTDERRKNYEIYNYLLSGSVFSSGTDEEWRNACKKYPTIWKMIEGAEQ
jgi:hypothetical protein